VPVLRQSIVDFVKRWEQTNPGQNVRVLTDALNHLAKSNGDGLPRTVWTTWYDMMGRVVKGQIDPLNGMREIEPIINAILEERYVSSPVRHLHTKFTELTRSHHLLGAG
jgi:hypothetical protein